MQFSWTCRSHLDLCGKERREASLALLQHNAAEQGKNLYCCTNGSSPFCRAIKTQATTYCLKRSKQENSHFTSFSPCPDDMPFSNSKPSGKRSSWLKEHKFHSLFTDLTRRKRSKLMYRYLSWLLTCWTQSDLSYYLIGYSTLFLKPNSYDSQLESISWAPYLPP